MMERVEKFRNARYRSRLRFHRKLALVRGGHSPGSSQDIAFDLSLLLIGHVEIGGQGGK